MIQTPYLLFLGDAADPLAAKVAQGFRDWRPDYAVGQFRMAGCKADMKLPDMTLAEARAAGVNTVVVGVANRGGVISQAWIAVLIAVLIAALKAGFDLASGLHYLLWDEPDPAAAVARTGRALDDGRVPSVDYPIANGVTRRGKRRLARVANRACVAVGVSISTRHMTDVGASAYLAGVEAWMGRPAVDPFRHGAGRLADALAAI